MTERHWLWMVYGFQLLGASLGGFIFWAIALVISIVKTDEINGSVLGAAHHRWQNMIFWIIFIASLLLLILPSAGPGFMLGMLASIIAAVCTGYGMFCLFYDRIPRA